jgi:hypothetical protein
MFNLDCDFLFAQYSVNLAEGIVFILHLDAFINDSIL